MPYQPTPIRAPRLTGTPLRLLVWLAERSWLGAPLRAFMLKDLGISAFRDLEIDESPTVMPPLPRLGSLGPDAAPPPMGLGATSAAAHAQDGFRFVSASDLAEAYRDGTVTPSDITERVIANLAEVEKRRPPLRAIIAHDAADVRRQAELATARWKSGSSLGPLDGIPVAVKDEVDQAGYKTTGGTRFLGTTPAKADATAVAKLRAGGAILIGKANMHEIGLGVTGLNLHHGTPRNPYGEDRFTGGSSSGSAAAVAAGLCPLALGADGGGSIRVPSGLCGVVGLKPTFGRVSEHGAVPICWSVGHIGPIAASAFDAALGYLTMAGEDPLDPATIGQPMPHLRDLGLEDLVGISLGIYRAWFEDADPEVVKTCDAMVDRLKQAGAKVREIEIPDLHLVGLAHSLTILVEMAAAQWRFYRAFRGEYGLDVRMNLALARGLGPTDYVHAQRMRRRICTHVATVFQDVDAIVTPTTGCTAPPIKADALAGGESDLPTLDRVMRFARLANLTGHPAISFPAGYAVGGLPIGLQCMGRPWHEHVLLRIAACAERQRAPQRPAIHLPLLDQLKTAVKSR